MAEIVRERDGLGEIFVQAERPRNRPADGSNFDRMR
jgi:hypothetical protein